MDLCRHLEQLENMTESAESMHVIDRAWTNLVNELTDNSRHTKSARSQLVQLDRIFKLELLGYESADFNWDSVNWLEIKSAANNCLGILSTLTRIKHLTLYST